MTIHIAKENPFREWVRLEQPRLGTRVVFASDEFFAAKERLIDPAEPKFVPDLYDGHGKWMDGWESRRRRTPGHDYCIIRLGIPGCVHGVDIDTSHFTGNFPPAASIDVCESAAENPDSGWQTLLPKVSLGGDAHHYLPVRHSPTATHLRLNIFPDGGIARLRVYGEVRPDWRGQDRDARIDLYALENGGRAILCSNEHFGSMHNLNVATRGDNMGDGWETARRRGPGHDWVLVALGHPGRLDAVQIDTGHFKGNYPDRVVLQAGLCTEENSAEIELASRSWPVILPETKLNADCMHEFEDELENLGTVSHVRVSVIPDGGISRLRLFGRRELRAADG